VIEGHDRREAAVTSYALTHDIAVFADRVDAGRQLGARLRERQWESPVVLGLPRGGVVVAAEVARALGAPLDVVVVRKIGAPGRPELGLGAVADGDEPLALVNDGLIASLQVSGEHLRDETARQLMEVRRRQSLLRQGRRAIDLHDRTAIVVDDGIATGGSMRAALRMVRRSSPRTLVLAVPVAPPETMAELARDADEIVCLVTPPDFVAVGRFYWDFRQTTDDEVIALLAEQS